MGSSSQGRARGRRLTYRSVYNPLHAFGPEPCHRC
jgi:hypothetical protein